MAKVVGSVDDRGRPVIRIEVGIESILVVVDTGFNAELMVTRDAARLLGVEQISRESDVELGDGSVARVMRGRARINWLESSRLVRVFVADNWMPIGDAPVGLIGTGLLRPHLLMIDFAERTVEIETRD